MTSLGKNRDHLLSTIDQQLRQINHDIRGLIPIRVIQSGDGHTYPKSGQTVQVKYIGKLPNGSVFDRSPPNQPFTFQVDRNQVIKGWDHVVKQMSLGERVRVKIPPKLAYGSKGAGGGKIPPNTTLTFVMKLVSVR